MLKNKTMYCKKLFLVLICLISSITYAQKNVNATLQNVTVYSNGAELSHTAKATVNAGTSEIIIGNLSNAIDQNSIQIGSSNDLTIMSVVYRLTASETPIKSSELLRVEELLKKAVAEQSKLNGQKTSLIFAKQILESNKQVSGQHTGLSVLELQKYVDYFITKNEELNTKLITLEEIIAKQNEEVAKIQNQYNELAGTNKASKGEVVLQVLSNTTALTTFNVSYVTYTAAWNPIYDLKTNSTKSPLKIIYKANVVQSSGIDWNDVKLTISTANPSQSGAAPILSTWFLNYYQPNYGYYKATEGAFQNKLNSYGNAPASAAPTIRKEEEKMEDASVNQFTTTNETALNATFDIDLPYDIASDGMPHSVSMKEYEVPATYKYYTAPRKDKDAFLMAEVSDWEQLNLVAGEANIIFDGTYVGKSFIDPNSTQDTLNISLGRDKKVVVKREKLVDYCSAKLIGSKREHTITYEIRIKNTRKESIDVLLKDQFPISQDKDIEVELLESSDASINNETGILTWKLNIGSGDTKKIKISYKVRFPKDKQVGTLY